MGSHYNQLTVENREIIRDMLYSGKSAREISRRIGVSASTITREIKNNKTFKIPALRSVSKSIYCKNYNNCQTESKVCAVCNNCYTLCKACRKVQCTNICKDFSPVICELTEK